MPFGIGVENLKRDVNLGTLLRSAYNFGAAFVFTVGRRYVRQASDTPHTTAQIPCFRYLDWSDYFEHQPFDWPSVVVERCEGTRTLFDFTHPKRCVYLLGPEDGSVSKEAIQRAAAKVEIPSKFSLNVSTAGSIVMYDRLCKER